MKRTILLSAIVLFSVVGLNGSSSENGNKKQRTYGEFLFPGQKKTVTDFVVPKGAYVSDEGTVYKKITVIEKRQKRRYDDNGQVVSIVTTEVPVTELIPNEKYEGKKDLIEKALVKKEIVIKEKSEEKSEEEEVKQVILPNCQKDDNFYVLTKDVTITKEVTNTLTDRQKIGLVVLAGTAAAYVVYKNQDAIKETAVSVAGGAKNQLKRVVGRFARIWGWMFPVIQEDAANKQ